MTLNLVVGDLMTIDPVTIAPDATIEEAERLLDLYDITGLPVVDETGRPIGVISQTDLLASATQSVGQLIRGKASGLRVGEIMSSPAITVPLLSPLGDAARLMRDSRVHRLVAIDEQGRAVGVLSATDFVTLYAEM
jgi:CBS domain-containing protein